MSNEMLGNNNPSLLASKHFLDAVTLELIKLGKIDGSHAEKDGGRKVSVYTNSVIHCYNNGELSGLTFIVVNMDGDVRFPGHLVDKVREKPVSNVFAGSGEFNICDFVVVRSKESIFLDQCLRLNDGDSAIIATQATNKQIQFDIVYSRVEQ